MRTDLRVKHDVESGKVATEADADSRNETGHIPFPLSEWSLDTKPWDGRCRKRSPAANVRRQHLLRCLLLQNDVVGAAKRKARYK